MTDIGIDYKTAIITGASGGLGIETVRLFEENKFRVIAIDNDKDGLDRLKGNVLTKEMDVTHIDQVMKAAGDFDINKTGLDILVCLAGVYETFPVTEANPEKFRRIMEVNLQGTVNMVSAFMPSLVRNQGRVIVVSSESYKLQALFQPYMISKAALEAYCLTARQELALKGVKLSVIRPGAIKTPLLKWMNEKPDPGRYNVFDKEYRASFEQSVKIVGKITSPESVAGIIYQAATSSYPKRVYRINNSMLLRVISVLPKRLFDCLVVSKFKIKKGKG